MNIAFVFKTLMKDGRTVFVDKLKAENKILKGKNSKYPNIEIIIKKRKDKDGFEKIYGELFYNGEKHISENVNKDDEIKKYVEELNSGILEIKEDINKDEKLFMLINTHDMKDCAYILTPLKKYKHNNTTDIYCRILFDSYYKGKGANKEFTKDNYLKFLSEIGEKAQKFYNQKEKDKEEYHLEAFKDVINL